MKKILYVGMDVHKESIAIACGAEGEKIRHYGTIPNHLAALDTAARKLVSSGHISCFVYYEAGPGGSRYTGICAITVCPAWWRRRH